MGHGHVFAHGHLGAVGKNVKDGFHVATFLPIVPAMGGSFYEVCGDGGFSGALDLVP